IVDGFVNAVETRWQARADEDVYRARVSVTRLTPAELYCGRSADAAGAACTVPAIGEKVDLAMHAKHFPADGAVLTTGAASLQITAGRVLVLGPHDVSPRTLAHEFG